LRSIFPKAKQVVGAEPIRIRRLHFFGRVLAVGRGSPTSLTWSLPVGLYSIAAGAPGKDLHSVRCGVPWRIAMCA